MPEHALTTNDDLRLVELVNRVLDRGVVLTGDVLISVAGIDLVYVGLRLMLSSIETAREHGVAGLPPE